MWLLQSQRRAGGISILLRSFSSTHRYRPRTLPRPRTRRGPVTTAAFQGEKTVTTKPEDFPHDCPTRQMAETMPETYQVMCNTSLTTLGAMGNHAALQEMLKRHIMRCDNLTYEQASAVFLEIEAKNHELEIPLALPFQIGISACFLAGFLSIPMVFHLPTVEYFNEHFVTAEHPPTKELETALEVGSWSWNWMEPVMGTSTFLLLTMQYMRQHLQHLGVTPYTHHMKRFRGKRLADAFPQYNDKLLFAYSESSPMYNPKDLWI